MDKGLDALTAAEKEALKAEYSAFLGAAEGEAAGAAREVVDWLSGRYHVTKDLFLTQ